LLKAPLDAKQASDPYGNNPPGLTHFSLGSFSHLLGRNKQNQRVSMDAINTQPFPGLCAEVLDWVQLQTLGYSRTFAVFRPALLHFVGISLKTFRRHYMLAV